MFASGDNAAFSYTLLAAAVVITGGRTYIRFSHLRRLDACDWLALAALAFLISFIAVENKLYPFDVEVWEFHAGYGPRPSDDHVIYDYKLQVVEACLMTGAMSCVKLSLLCFYRSIFGVNKRFARVCEFTMVGVLIVLVYVITAQFWICGEPIQLFELAACTSSHANDVRKNNAIAGCILCLATDLTIITLPILMLRKLRITFAQKLGLAMLFTLAASDIILEIPRTVYAITYSSLELSVVWSMLECSIAVIVCNLPMYRGLFGVAVPRRSAGASGSTSQKRRSKQWYGSYGTSTTKSNVSVKKHTVTMYDDSGKVLDGGDLFGSRTLAGAREVPLPVDENGKVKDLEMGKMEGRKVIIARPGDEQRDSDSEIVIIQQPSPAAQNYKN